MTGRDNRRAAAEAALAVIAIDDEHGGYCVVSITSAGRVKAHPEIYDTREEAASAARQRKAANPATEQIVAFSGTRAIWVLGTGGAVLGTFDRATLRASRASRRRR